MANLNSVHLIGRLTRDPETVSMQSGAKLAKFSLAVTNRKKNASTGQWEDEPMYIDVTAWNGYDGKGPQLANLIEECTRKGSQIFVDGKLILEQWKDKTTGANRSKHTIKADGIQLLDKKDDSAGGGTGGGARSSGGNANSGGGYSSNNSEPPDDNGDGPPDNGDIPF